MSLPSSADRGFTLIELITVLVILAVLGAVSSQFVVDSINSYYSTIRRAELIAQGRQALERISRQVRLALPHSLRTTNGGACLEFIPISGGGSYIGDLPDQNNGAAAISIVPTGGYQIDSLWSQDYIYVGALNTTEIYSASGAYASIAGAEDHGDSNLSLAASHQFLRNSPTQRFFLAGNPVSFCLNGGQLGYYSSYASSPTDGGSVSPAADANDLIAGNVSAIAPFNVTVSNPQRNSMVDITISFSRGGESVLLNQQVVIRNVP